MGLPVVSMLLPLASIPNEMQALGYALLGTAAFGLLGILLMLAGFKAFEALTSRLDVEKQLEAGNMAVGVTVGSLLLGVSVIVVVSML
jgi:uncharacterized membrane protein YjfL (UPF0719 family)